MAVLIQITVAPPQVPLSVFLRRVAAVCAAQICVVAVGILAGSAALQWLGALILIVIVAGSFVHLAKDERRPLTIAEARAKLDEVEARNG